MWDTVWDHVDRSHHLPASCHVTQHSYTVHFDDAVSNFHLWRMPFHNGHVANCANCDTKDITKTAATHRMTWNRFPKQSQVDDNVRIVLIPLVKASSKAATVVWEFGKKQCFFHSSSKDKASLGTKVLRLLLQKRVVSTLMSRSVEWETVVTLSQNGCKKRQNYGSPPSAIWAKLILKNTRSHKLQGHNKGRQSTKKHTQWHQV